jgi:D-beta-D-heptose 7-phosphate kinase/D-beta-D-heptose 1-phosphate adenosyltransferase
VSVEHGQQVFRVDEESTHPVVDNVQEQILSLIREKAAHANVIVCSDYLKGVLTGTVLHTAFTEGKKHGIPVIVAPKDSDVVKYRGASILVPNLKELGKLIGTAPNGNGWLVDSARSLMATLGLEALLVTRGSQGMSLFEPGRAGLRHVEIPTVAKTVYDVTGAGDTGIAAFAAGIAAGATRETAAHIANIAAGIVVGKPGTTSVTIQEIQNHLPTVDAANGAESYGVSPVSR